MPPRRRKRGFELGLILLLNELLRYGMKNIPPATLSLIIGQALLYMEMFNVPWSKNDVSISGNAIIKEKDWKRLLLSAFEHIDDMHLYYNMASFLLKGRILEKRYGSKNFGCLILFLILITSAMYVLLAFLLSELLGNESYMMTRAIGFSGVIFALKVLLTFEEPNLKAKFAGFIIPGKYAAWIELILIHFIVPNSSCMGHLSGIIAGVIYCNTIIGKVIDKILFCITGQQIIHKSQEVPPIIIEKSKSNKDSLNNK